MARKKILWLCSWYPSKTEPFNGDFVQRHAKAAAIYNDIHVIHVFAVRGKEVTVKEEFLAPVAGLSEQVIYYNYSALLFGRLVSYFKMISLYKKAVRNYIQRHGKPTLLHVHIPLKSGIAAVWAKARYQLPLLVSEHWGIYNEVVKDNYQGRNPVFKAMARKIYASANNVSSVSRFLGECLQKYFGIKKVQVIYNAVNTDLFYLKENNRERFRFIHVSNMVPLKNVEGMLRAFKVVSKYHDAELVMVGNTDDHMQRYVASLDISDDRILFRGEVPYEQVALEMQDANCLLLFSDMENSPCVIGEALCCGLPVIATAVGGIPELLTEQYGFLVAARDEEQLTLAMEKMLNKYSSFNRQQISEHARKRFSYKEIGNQFDDLYETMISEK